MHNDIRNHVGNCSLHVSLKIFKRQEVIKTQILTKINRWTGAEKGRVKLDLLPTFVTHPVGHVIARNMCQLHCVLPIFEIFLLYILVLCAHGGKNFDFLILVNNMVKYDVDWKYLRYLKVQFADTFEHCQKVGSFKACLHWRFLLRF